MTLRNVLLILLLLSFGVLNAQVNILKFPSDYEVIHRDTLNNKGYVDIEFELTPNETPSDIKLKRTKNQTIKTNIPINYTISNNGTFHYQITDTIETGLTDYDYELLYRNNIIKTASSLCVGDYYIFYGQSNALAKSQSTSSSIDFSPYIRTYGTISQSQIDNQWKIATGDNENENGFIGQLGIAFGKQIIENEKIPICILNGSVGGKEISFFMRGDSLRPGQINLKTAYGRLLNRVKQSNSQNFIRAVIWYQGENDAKVQTDKETYIERNLNLFKQLQEDYPNIENFYMFQIKNACKQNIIANNTIQQAQLEVASQSKKVHLISTGDIALGKDNCHYNYENGYRVLGKRIYQLAKYFQYNQSYTDDDFYPAPVKVKSYKSNVVIYFNHASKINLDANCAIKDFYLNDSLNPKQIKSKMNTLILSFDKEINSGNFISYTSAQNQKPCPILNNSNNQILSFSNFPIDTVYDQQINPFIFGENENSNIEESNFFQSTDIKKNDQSLNEKCKVFVPLNSNELHILNNTIDDINVQILLYNLIGKEISNYHFTVRPGHFVYPIKNQINGLFFFKMLLKSKSFIEHRTLVAHLP